MRRANGPTARQPARYSTVQSTMHLRPPPSVQPFVYRSVYVCTPYSLHTYALTTPSQAKASGKAHKESHNLHHHGPFPFSPRPVSHSPFVGQHLASSSENPRGSMHERPVSRAQSSNGCHGGPSTYWTVPAASRATYNEDTTTETRTTN